MSICQIGGFIAQRLKKSYGLRARYEYATPRQAQVAQLGDVTEEKLGDHFIVDAGKTAQ